MVELVVDREVVVQRLLERAATKGARPTTPRTSSATGRRSTPTRPRRWSTSTTGAACSSGSTGWARSTRWPSGSSPPRAGTRRTRSELTRRRAARRADGRCMLGRSGPGLKTPEQIQLMRRAGVLVGETLELLRESARAGITTAELDALAEEHIRARRRRPVVHRRPRWSGRRRLPGHAVHLGQRRGRARHPGPARARRRRPRLDRLRGHRRRLARRRGDLGHRGRRGRRARGPGPGRGDRAPRCGTASPRCGSAAGCTTSARRSRTSSPAGSRRPGRPGVRHRRGLRRARHRPLDARGPPGAELPGPHPAGPRIAAGLCVAVEPMLTAGSAADPDPGRRLDRGHRRRRPGGALRALGRGHRRGPVGAHRPGRRRRRPGLASAPAPPAPSLGRIPHPRRASEHGAGLGGFHHFVLSR